MSCLNRGPGEIEGDAPHYSISLSIAKNTHQLPSYTKTKGLDKAKLRQMVLQYLSNAGEEGAKRDSIYEYLKDVLPQNKTEEQKLRGLGDLLKTMKKEKIQKLRQMDREDFLEERRYREHLDETMQDMDSIKEKDSELFARDVKELLDHIGDKRIYELLKETEHQTLEILLLSTWGYSGREVAKIMGMAEQTIYTKRNRLRKKLKNLSKIE